MLQSFSSMLKIASVFGNMPDPKLQLNLKPKCRMQGHGWGGVGDPKPLNPSPINRWQLAGPELTRALGFRGEPLGSK